MPGRDYSMRMLQKPSRGVLVHPLQQARQWVPVKASTYRKEYASTFRSLRPSWEDFFTILWLTQPGPERLFDRMEPLA